MAPRAPAPYLDSCTDCGEAKSPAKNGPQLDEEQSTATQAVYVCPRTAHTTLPKPDGSEKAVKPHRCGLVHVVNLNAAPRAKKGR